MARPTSIRFDDVLELLRGPVVQAFEAEYAARLGYGVYPDWGDSQKLTKELASTGITRTDLEAVLTTDRPMLIALCDAIMAMPDDEEEWPPGEEPDEDDKPEQGERLPLVGRGFSITHACTLWLLRNRTDADLVAWVKVRRIPFHRKHARELRTAYDQLKDQHSRKDG